MNKTKQLLVRACKSFNPHVRLRSVYKRQYWRGAPDHLLDFYIAELLSGLCDDYDIITTSKLVSALHPDNAWKHGLKSDDDYYTRVVKVLTSKIRLTKVAKFPGLTSPLRFKNHFTQEIQTKS
jgi:hypothetical protein